MFDGKVIAQLLVLIIITLVTALNPHRPMLTKFYGASCNLRRSSSVIHSRRFARLSPFKVSAKGFDRQVPSPTIHESPLTILQYPHPKLRSDNEIVAQFDDKLIRLVADMFSIMYATDGIGLAAPQVGINKRLLVFNKMSGSPERGNHEMVLANPFIVRKSKEMSVGEEGCLSFPNIYGEVLRHIWIEVEYQDVRGMKNKKKFENEEAIIFQHEYDHLDKILFIDHFTEEDILRSSRKLRRLIDKFGDGGLL